MRFEPRYAFAHIWIFDEDQAVPDLATDVEFVVQDASAAFSVAVQDRRAPNENALTVEGTVLNYG